MSQYLTGMPTKFNQYGLNKTLIIRALTIDWKHRDTEIHLRNPNLLDVLNTNQLRELYKIRAQQLRYIYHISRSAFDNTEPDNLVDFLIFWRKQNFIGFDKNANTFISFDSILAGDITNEDLIKNACIFSFKAKQSDMINFFIQKSLRLPKLFIIAENMETLQPYLEKAISVVLCKDNTFTHTEKIWLFACNFHIYFTWNNNNYECVSFKTDTKLSKMQILS